MVGLAMPDENPKGKKMSFTIRGEKEDSQLRNFILLPNKKHKGSGKRRKLGGDK